MERGIGDSQNVFYDISLNDESNISKSVKFANMNHHIIETIICDNCTESFSNQKAYESHLFNDRSCFFPITECFWYRKLYEKHICRICGNKLSDKFMLKKHYFESIECKRYYINLSTRHLKPTKMLKHTSGNERNDNETIKRLTHASRKEMNGNETTKRLTHTSRKEMNDNETTKRLTHTSRKERNDNETTLDTSCYNFSSEDSNDYVASTTSNLRQELSNIFGSSPQTTSKFSANCQLGKTSTEKGVKLSSISQLEYSKTVALSSFTANNNQFNSKHKHHLRSKSIITCDACGKQFKSMKIKNMHLEASTICRNINTCLCCKNKFSNEREKIEHINLTIECQLFLKDSFINGNFFSKAKICENYTLNKFMCPFCLFTIDNGDVFHHILTTRVCWQKLEDAIIKYKNEMTIPSTAETETRQQKQFACNICNRSFRIMRSLTYHKTRVHHELSKRNGQKIPQKLDVRRSYHLYCLLCRKFLKTETEIKDHHCNHTRFLSRSCYDKAVWRDGEYECKLCSDTYFYVRNDLARHMHQHEKRTSPLFSFVPDTLKAKKMSLAGDSFDVNITAATVTRKIQPISNMCETDFNNMNETDFNNMNETDFLNITQTNVMTTLNQSCFNNIRNNDNSHYVILEQCSENKQTSSVKDFVGASTVYRCNACQLTLPNSSHFVLHISQEH